MDRTRMALAVAMVPLVMLGGCGESNNKDLQEEHHTPGLASTLPKDGQVAEQGPAREEDHWPLPLYPLAPPPAAGGPEIPPDKSPSIYTDARIGMRTVIFLCHLAGSFLFSPVRFIGKIGR
ncbi:MAG TPA: hypothetical protein ENH84_01125 [Phycisphaerae bacterium]|nr:hypothetical protein [Phycisphaerae bacterium]